MGFDLSSNVDYQIFDLELGDQFLMTTDGVHDYLQHASLAILMGKTSSANEIVE